MPNDMNSPNPHNSSAAKSVPRWKKKASWKCPELHRNPYQGHLDVTLPKPQDGLQQAGFRAWKRCKPENKTHDPEARVRRKVDQAVVSLKMAAEKGKRVGLNELSNTIGVSKWHLRREFLRITGLSPYQMASILLDPVSAQRGTVTHLRASNQWLISSDYRYVVAPVE